MWQHILKSITFGKLDELRPTDEKTEIYHTNTRYDLKLLF